MTPPAAVAAIASLGLPTARAPWPETVLDGETWAAVFARVTSERLTGLLAEAVASGLLPATASQAEAAENAHISAMRRVVSLEQTLLAEADALEHAGVELRLLKGLAVCHLDEENASRRTFNDIDVLARGEDLKRVGAVLTSRSFARDLPERRPGFDRRFGKEITLRRGDVEIDVHRTIVLGAFGLAGDIEPLWARSTEVVIGGRPFSALSTEGRALHAAAASLLSDPQPRLVQLRDLALVLCRPDLEHERLLDLAARSRLEAVLAHAIRLACATLLLEETPLLEWSLQHQPDRWSRLALRTYESTGGSNTLTLLGGALGLRRWRDRAAYLGTFVFPSRAYVEARRRAARPPERRRGLQELVRSLRRGSGSGTGSGSGMVVE